MLFLGRHINGWSGEISRFHENKFCPRQIKNRSDLIRVGPASHMSETGLTLFFKPISCKLKQGFVWEVISSRAGSDLVPVSYSAVKASGPRGLTETLKRNKHIGT